MASRRSLVALLAVSALWAAVTGARGEAPDSPPEGPLLLAPLPALLPFPNTRGALLPCSALGRPAPVMGWRRADVDDDVTALDDVTGLLHVLPNNTLHFLPFSAESYTPEVHAGKFRCTATNSVGTVVSRTVTIRADLVDKLRTYNAQVHDVYVTSGGTAVLTCDVNPYFMRDHVTVTSWTRGGHNVTSGGRYSLLPGGQLHVRDVTSHDTYVIFTCVTRNTVTSEVKRSAPASIHVIDPVTSAPAVERPLSRLVVAAGGRAELPCVARGYPLPRYAWTRDDVTLGPSTTTAGGNLVLDPVTEDDTGSYMCTASNRLGAATTRVLLTVTSPLSAHVTPSQQTVDVGSDATFNCSVYGGPVLRVRWLHNGRLLTSGGRVSFPSATSLLVPGVTRADRGMYQCVVHGVTSGTGGPTSEALGAAQLDLGASRPVMTSRSDDLYVRPGDSVSLHCAVAGSPTPHFRWTLADGPLPRDVRYRLGRRLTSHGDVISYVNVTRVRVEDGGVFRCTATNQQGEISHVTKLHVYGLPYIRPMGDVTAVAGHVLVLRCHVAGYPIKEVSWVKDGMVLPSDHRQHVSSDGTLSVDDVTRGHDDGVYTCRAADYNGHVTSRQVTVTLTEPPVIDPFRFPTRKSGDRVTVSCAVSRGDLPIRIMWYKDGRPLPADLGVRVQETGSYSSQLYIRDAAPRHDGNYTCEASNMAAKVNRTARLVVNVPPRWVVAPHDSFVVLGRDVTLNCQADGKPEPEVVWRKAKGDQPGNYEDIFTGNATSDDVTSGDVTGRPRLMQMANGSLYIDVARAEDHGYWLCHVSNGVGRALSKVIQLVVHVPARFPVAARNQSVLVGEPTTLTCEARGDRPLSVSWTFNGQTLDWTNDPRLEVAYYHTEDGRGSKLVVSPAARGDTGFYVCNAKNNYGSDVTMIQLTIQEPPSPPRHVTVRQTGGGQVKVTWETPYDGNSPITGYDVTFKHDTELWNETSVQHTNVRDLPATINDLHPAYTYHFRVSAINSIGQGAPSDVITVTMGEEVPSGPPTGVKVTAIGSRSINVTWQPPLPVQQNGEVTGYFIGYKQHNRSAPYMYVTQRTTSGLEVILNDLDKFTPYTVHVQAFNARGTGPASEDVITWTLEDVPSQPPGAVQGTALTSQSVLVTWTPPPLRTLHGVLQGYRVLYKPVRNDEDETDAEVVTTSRLTAVLYHLSRFTNYSVQVLAYTRRGEGVRSPPIYVTTRQDLPDRPANIKAVPAGLDTILVSWREPVNTNGIITKYTLYMHDVDSTLTAIDTRLELPADRLTYRAKGLTHGHKYSFRVSASTLVGDGETTHTVTATTVENCGARIASFPLTLHTTWQADVTLPCIAVGDPKPTVSWQLSGLPVVESEHVKILTNGSLHISHVSTRDAGNYTCRVENVHGADEVSVSLLVQAPPKAPILSLAATTDNTLQINWRSSSNGGSPIKGFIVTVKRYHGDDERSTTLGPTVRTHTANSLQCGTRYHVTVLAYNSVGQGAPSNIVSAKTNGSAPIMPPQSMLIHQLNATFVDLDLTTWLSGGCPVTSFDIRYRYWGDAQWETVDSFIPPDTPLYRVNLHPATWYVLRVTAHNEAGATDSTLKFATPTYHGGTIKPIRVVHRNALPFHEKAYVMIPLVGCLVVVVVLTVALILFCKRRQDKLAYKAENASNLRRDLTAETSLMSDLEKRANTDLESPTSTHPREGVYTTPPTQSPKVPNTDGDPSRDNRQTSPSNSLHTEPDDETSHYATLRCQRHLSEEDVVALEKAAALQRLPHSTSPPEPRYHNVPTITHDQGLILNPQHYALMESLRGLPQPRLPQPYGQREVGGPGTHAHNDKPTNRISTVSNNTCDSSNREELSRVFDLGRLPEFTPSGERSSAAPDLGVKRFTQSPPIKGPVTSGTAVPQYCGVPHLPKSYRDYRPTPFPRRVPSITNRNTCSDDSQEASSTHPNTSSSTPSTSTTRPTNPLQHQSPQRPSTTSTKSLEPPPQALKSPKRLNVSKQPLSPWRRGALGGCPPPPPPPPPTRGTSAAPGARFSPCKVRASPEERRPLFPTPDQAQTTADTAQDADEDDVLLEKYYRMLRHDLDPSTHDDITVLGEQLHNEYSMI